MLPLAAMNVELADQLLTTTRSVRKRLDLKRPVEPAVIERALEVALQAPTGSNAQGWHFLVVTDPKKRAGIAALYKRAWDLVDEINRICRQAAVARQTGGKNGGGAVLTPFGTSLIARYRKIERNAASAARKELEALRKDIGRPKKAAR